jgi:hypothetical protein
LLEGAEERFASIRLESDGGARGDEVRRWCQGGRAGANPSPPEG